MKRRDCYRAVSCSQESRVSLLTLSIAYRPWHFVTHPYHYTSIEWPPQRRQWHSHHTNLRHLQGQHHLSRILEHHQVHPERRRSSGTSTRKELLRTQGEESVILKYCHHSVPPRPIFRALLPLSLLPQGQVSTSSSGAELQLHPRKQLLFARPANSRSRMPQGSANLARRLSSLPRFLANLHHHSAPRPATLLQRTSRNYIRSSLEKRE